MLYNGDCTVPSCLVMSYDFAVSTRMLVFSANREIIEMMTRAFTMLRFNTPPAIDMPLNKTGSDLIGIDTSSSAACTSGRFLVRQDIQVSFFMRVKAAQMCTKCAHLVYVLLGDAAQ